MWINPIPLVLAFTKRVTIESPVPRLIPLVEKSGPSKPPGARLSSVLGNKACAILPPEVQQNFLNEQLSQIT